MDYKKYTYLQFVLKKSSTAKSDIPFIIKLLERFF